MPCFILIAIFLVIRQTYLIDPEGNLRWVFTDVQSRLAKHAEEVIVKLKELKA